LANEFDRELRRTRNPPAWQLNQWRAGLRWFLEFLGEKPAAQKPGSAASPSGNLAWRHRLIGQLRQKHLSYRAQNLVSGWQWSRETYSQPEGNESCVPGETETLAVSRARTDTRSRRIDGRHPRDTPGSTRRLGLGVVACWHRSV